MLYLNHKKERRKKMNFIDITNMTDTQLVDLLNAVTCEISVRENAERLNKQLVRLFQKIESSHLNLVDQETGEVLEYGRVLIQ
jgi:hypothetical protein